MHEMRSRLAGTVLAIVIAASAAACGASAASPSPSPSPAGATTFDEYATAFCSAWGTLFRVVGNPDTAGWTDGVHQLQAAADARDDATAARLQGEINTELEAARQQIASAAGWPPASRPMAEMDRFFVATETWITAYADVAKGAPGAPDPQAAFEAAGGLAAWQGMREAYADVAPHRPATVAQCPDAPITP
jgi:opacity protein-like surface antigen